MVSPISNSESTNFLTNWFLFQLANKLFWTNKKFAFFFNCSNWEKFVKQIGENIWWVCYIFFRLFLVKWQQLFSFLLQDCRWSANGKCPWRMGSTQGKDIREIVARVIPRKYMKSAKAKLLLEAMFFHTSSVERFSENFDNKAVTYIIFFVGTHWFRKCDFWK